MSEQILSDLAVRAAQMALDHQRDRIQELESDNERLREALLEVEKWDVNWADGLDSNVERIKHFVREALEDEK